VKHRSTPGWRGGPSTRVKLAEGAEVVKEFPGDTGSQVGESAWRGLGGTTVLDVMGGQRGLHRLELQAGEITCPLDKSYE
jgi:hypothetical protein